MAEKKKKKIDVPYEERVSEGTAFPIKILSAIICFGIAAVTLYMAFASPREGTAMLSVRNFIRGLSGSLPFLLSLIFVWIGVLCIGASRGKRVNLFHIIIYLIMFLSIFAGVHVFSAAAIMPTLNVHSYWQFAATSFRNGVGGGVLGALIAYPLYEYIGEIGGCAVCVLLVVLCLVATGRASSMISWGREQNEKSRQRRSERDERRQQQENRAYVEQPVNRNGRQGGNRRPQAGGRSGSGRETPQQQVRSRQSKQIVRTVSQPNQKTMHIPDRDTAVNDRNAKNAFYEDKEQENTTSRRKKRVQQQGITIPTPISELKNASSKGKISRFSDPESTRRSAKNKDIDIAEEKQSSDSSVSVEAMSVLAEQAARNKETAKTLQNDPGRFEELTEEDIDEIFTIAEDKKDQATKEPAVSKPRIENVVSTRTVDNGFSGGITREQNRGRKERTFVETEDPEYNYPPIDLLEHGERDDQVKKHEESDRMKADILMDTLQSFGIRTRLSGIAHGPAVTRFELQPDAGIKVSRITSLSDDIAMALAAESVRIEAPIPGKSAVGVEIPNDKVETVRLRDVLESSEALHNTSKIAVGLGKDNSGRYVVTDIAKMPHVLIAGQTGSGKSVCINSIITSILYRSTPEDVRMILIDPKVVELQVYNDIPHLIAPVVTDPKKASSALQWSVSEMLERYKKFSKKGVRNIKGYNAALKGDEKKMPQIVIVIDELADLMMAAPGEVEDSICRIAQLARAAGMHLVIATQRPSVNVITGIIKANIPTRIAFAVASQMDSRVMIDHGGAEKLLGNGDMLFVPNGGKTLRVQGTWVSDEEVEAVVGYIKERCDPNYDEDVQEKIENSVKSDAEIEDSNNELDDRLAEAVEIVVELGQASVSMLQRKMRVGYARAGRLVDEMQKRGIVSEADGAKPRSVLITREQFREMFGEDV